MSTDVPKARRLGAVSGAGFLSVEGIDVHRGLADRDLFFRVAQVAQLGHGDGRHVTDRDLLGTSRVVHRVISRHDAPLDGGRELNDDPASCPGEEHDHGLGLEARLASGPGPLGRELGHALGLVGVAPTRSRSDPEEQRTAGRVTGVIGVHLGRDEPPGVTDASPVVLLELVRRHRAESE